MKEIADKEQNTIKDIVKRVFGEGKAYGDGYSSYICARYKDGVWQESQIGGRSDLSSINILEKKLGANNLKKLNRITLIENYD